MQPLTVIDCVLTYADSPLAVTDDQSFACVVREDGQWKLKLTLVGKGANRITGNMEQARIEREMLLVIGRLPNPEDMAGANQPVWGFTRLGPTVWKPRGMPMPVSRTQLCYVTVVGCPDPAPWDGPTLAAV